jgi:hypothetical protein
MVAEKYRNSNPGIEKACDKRTEEGLGFQLLHFCVFRRKFFTNQKTSLSVYLSQDVSELRWPLQILTLIASQPRNGQGGEAIAHKVCFSSLPFQSSLPLLLWRSWSSQIFCVQYTALDCGLHFRYSFGVCSHCVYCCVCRDMRWAYPPLRLSKEPCLSEGLIISELILKWNRPHGLIRENWRLFSVFITR